jgi:hypothetical protein
LSRPLVVGFSPLLGRFCCQSRSGNGRVVRVHRLFDGMPQSGSIVCACVFGGRHLRGSQLNISSLLHHFFKSP